MASKDLYDLVSKTIQDGDSKISKVQIGYTVDSYKGVLSALKNIKDNTVRSGGGSVMGDDYSGLTDIRFDNNNFSENVQAALWKMEFGLYGAIPVLNTENQKHFVICTKGYSLESMNQTGNNKTIPPFLQPDMLQNTWERGEGFQNGVYIDIDNHLWKYMDKFFTGNVAQGSFTKEIVQALVTNRCLVAQIIPINGGGTVEALVIGKTGISNNSRILASPCMFASQSFSQLGFGVTVSGAGKSFTILPQSTDGNYRCPISGANYDVKNGFIKGLDVNSWENWLRNQEDGSAYEIVQPTRTEFHVRIYIPADKRAKAETILPQGFSQAIFNTYSAIRTGPGNIPAGLSADVNRMMQCITEACEKFGCKLYTANDVKDAMGSPTAMGSDGSWIQKKGGGRSTAMAGEFAIPNGWPMSTIIQDYGGRSAADQRAKGHPKQGSGEGVVPWVEAEEGRLDSALAGKLSGTILSGNMPREWYQQRIEKSNLGLVRIRCNSAVQNKFQQLFDNSWAVYGEAANIYNIGRPAEEQVSAGEIILRCAPCICAINGQSGVHRSRKNKQGQWRQAGHDGGAAIDFDPSNNYVTSSKNTNCFTQPIGKNMEVGYRPFIHYLYALGGGWGGSYKFCDGQFDSMHIQF